LIGDLGGGKTQFTKGLAQGLGIKEVITSPTFNYQNIYQGDKLALYHFDLYRSNYLDSDIRDMMFEAFSDPSGITVVEWAEKAKEYWPKNSFVIKFNWISGNVRRIDVR